MPLKFFRKFRGYIKGLGVEREFEDAERYLHINRGNGNLFDKVTIESEKGKLIYERSGIDWFCRYEENKSQ